MEVTATITAAKMTKRADGLVESCYAFAAHRGQVIFIHGGIHHLLGYPSKGSTVRLLVGPSKRKPGTLAAEDIGSVSRHASVPRYNDDPHDSKLQLPDTKPGTPHNGLDLLCYQCGSLLAEASEIRYLHAGAIWLSGLPDRNRVEPGKNLLWNPHKKVPFHVAECSACQYKVGTIYLEPYAGSSDPGKQFPCCQLQFRHKRPNNQFRQVSSYAATSSKAH